MHRVVTAWLSIALLVVLLSAWSGSLWAQDTPGPRPREELDQAIAALAELEVAARAEFDVAAKARALGARAEDLFAFVRDEVRTEPYRGLLRGARGTLAARAGNDLDKAALLLALLRAHGHEARLASGSLTREQWSRLRAFPGAPVLAPAPEAAALRTKVLEREARYRRSVLAALKQAGIFLAAAAPQPSSPPHYYVVATLGGREMALDPAFADASLGQELASGRKLLEQFPAGELHRLTLRVVLETRQVKGFKTQEVLALHRTSEELAGRPILFLHQPAPDAAGILGGGSIRVQPVLIAQGIEPLAGPVFGDDKPAAQSSPPGQSGMGHFEGLFGRKHAAEVSAEWLEVEVRSPGRPPASERRYVFDRVAPGARSVRGDPQPGAALEPWRRHEGVPTAFQGQFALGVATGPADAMAWQIQDAAELRPILESVRERLAPGKTLEAQMPKLLETLSTPQRQRLDAICDLRQAAIALSFIGSSARLAQSLLGPSLLAADGPSVGLVRFGLEPARGQAPAVRFVLDATLRRQALYTGSGRAAPGENLRMSLLALAVESALVEQALSEGRQPTLRVGSAAAVLDTAERQGVPLKVLNAAALDGSLAALPPATRSRLLQALGQKAVVVGPEKLVGQMYAFLTLDPQTGELWDVVGDGLHGATVENLMVRMKTMWAASTCARCLGSILLFPFAMNGCYWKGAYPIPGKPIEWGLGRGRIGCGVTLFILHVLKYYNCHKCTGFDLSGEPIP